jgi:hypothetical protein
MKHHATPTFWQAYNRLPVEVRTLADRDFELLKRDPKHPSLHFKSVDRFWSARVGKSWRAVAVRDGDDVVWFWIGRHDECDKLVG